MAMHIIFQFALSDAPVLSPPPDESRDAATPTEPPSSACPFTRGISHVIVKKEFSELEPTLRRFFCDLPHVNIFVDRRWHTRRAPRPQPPPLLLDRRNSQDRRQAVSAFEVLVPLDQAMLA
jgi:hypothetical protein